MTFSENSTTQFSLLFSLRAILCLVLSAKQSMDSSATAMLACYGTLCALLIAVMAQISFTLPKSVSSVPITMQTFAVNVIPLLFGFKVGVLSAVFYYIAIGFGLPFGAGGEGGFQKLYGPTGGYLVGFIVASLQIGLAIESNPDHVLSALVIGSCIIFGAGAAWLPFGLSLKTGKKLSNFTNIRDVMMWGVIPFVPGDIIKIGLAVLVHRVFKQ